MIGGKAKYAGFSFDEDDILENYTTGKTGIGFRPQKSVFEREYGEIFYSELSINHAFTPKVVFSVDKIWFGIDVEIFDEFFEAKPIQFFPSSDDGYLLGLVGYKGGLVKCFSSRKLLLSGKEDARSKYMASFIINGQNFIMEIDDVCGLKRVDMYRGLTGFRDGFPGVPISSVVNCDDKQVAVLDTGLFYSKIKEYLFA